MKNWILLTALLFASPFAVAQYTGEDLRTGNTTVGQMMDDIETSFGEVRADVATLISIDPAVTAEGTSYGTGYLLTARETRVLTVTGSDYVVSLPEFSTMAPGTVKLVYNDDSADPLTLLPEESDDLGPDYATGDGPVIEPGWGAVVVVQDSANGILTHILPPRAPEEITGNTTLTRAQCFGGYFRVSSAAELELPAGDAIGGVPMVFTVKVTAAVAVSVDPNGSEILSLDGTSLTGGNKATAPSEAGRVATFIWSAEESLWEVTTDGWTNGGA